MEQRSWFEKAAMAAIEDVARAKREFTGDDVMNLLEKRSSLCGEGRALGPVMKRAEGLKLMEKTEVFKSSTRKTQHGSPRRVWRSLVFQE